MAWLGMASTVEDFLGAVCADRDEDGRFKVAGDVAPVSFMGAGDELLLDDSLQYFIQGKPHPLVADMTQTLGEGKGRGLRVTAVF
jgi:hypothetical protein